jgi:sulfatase maturation enzyme AslB (radical SAM superfamily)
MYLSVVHCACSHCDWRYACGEWCLSQWLAGVRYVAPKPASKEEEAAFAKEAEAAEAKWGEA